MDRLRTLALGILVLPLLVAAHAAEGAEDRAALVEKLVGEDSTARLAAYRALSEEAAPEVVPLLLKALPDSPETGQYYGVLILQQLPDKQKRAALERLTRAPSPHLRLLAGAALHRLGNRDAAKVVVAALRAEGVDDVTRALMLTRIYSLRDPDIQATVRGFLDAAHAPNVIQAAVYDVYLVRDKRAGERLEALCGHDDGSVRALAAGCLLVLGNAAQAGVLADAIRAGEVGTGELYKVKTFLGQARPAPPAVLAAAHARLKEETDPYALRTFVEILGEHGYAKAVPEIRGFLDHENALLSKAAFTTLARFPGALTPETMRALLKTGDDARRLAAADALRRADDFSGLDVALGILAAGAREQDRWEAATVLGRFRDAKVVDALIAALMDEHLTVRANAYNSLGGVLRVLFPYRRLDLARTGYTTTAATAARKASAAKIRAWWEARREADW